jgi:hypothetical protein
VASELSGAEPSTLVPVEKLLAATPNQVVDRVEKLLAATPSQVVDLAVKLLAATPNQVVLSLDEPVVDPFELIVFDETLPPQALATHTGTTPANAVRKTTRGT